MNKINTRAVGDKGEEVACTYLQQKGYTVLCRNYTCKGGEIDIIASKGEYLVFAEVKLRSGRQASERGAAFAVDAVKAARMCKAVRTFVDEYRDNLLVSSLKPRIDVLEVYKNGNNIDIRHSQTCLLEEY